LAALGRLDILVNNAAVMYQHESLRDRHRTPSWTRCSRANVLGYFYMARAAMEHLPAGGSIVNMRLGGGLRAQPESQSGTAETNGAIHNADQVAGDEPR